MLKTDDFLGRAHVNLDHLRLHDYEFFDEPLTGAKDDDRGSLRFSVHWLLVQTADGGDAGGEGGGSSGTDTRSAGDRSACPWSEPGGDAACAARTRSGVRCGSWGCSIDGGGGGCSSGGGGWRHGRHRCWRRRSAWSGVEASELMKLSE